jgi:hypothetical protein
MDAFRAPAEPTDEIDYAAARPSVVVAVAGGIQVFAGACTSTMGLQLFVFVTFYNLLWVLPYLLMPLGLVQMAIGAVASRGRDWASILGTAMCWGIQIGALLWAVYSFSQGFFSLLTLVWLAVNGLGSLIAPFGVPGALAASRARRALYR